MKLNYIIIPAITFLVVMVGGWFTGSGMGWYDQLKLPSFTPSGQVIGSVWTVLFILATASVLIVWNNLPRNQLFWQIIALFAVNAILNVTWSFLFFKQHMIGAAVFDAALLDLSVIGLIVLIWPLSVTAAALLVPYAGWVAFATYLNYVIWTIN